MNVNISIHKHLEVDRNLVDYTINNKNRFINRLATLYYSLTDKLNLFISTTGVGCINRTGVFKMILDNIFQKTSVRISH